MTSSAPNLPSVGDITGGSTTESAFQQAMADLFAFLAQLVVGSTQENLTIASGAITPTKGFFLVDPESGTTDDLTTISHTSIGSKLLIMKVATAGRTITLKHLAGGTGQLFLTNAADLPMGTTSQMIAFSWNSTSSRWDELWRSWGLNLPSAGDLSAAKTLLSLGTASALASSAVFQVSNNLSEGNASSMRASLALLGMALQSASAVSISGGTITGITDLAVADGGTGRSTLAAHGVVLGAGTSAVVVTGPGTTGQVFMSNGASADPSFQDLPASGCEKIGEYNLNGLTGQDVTWTAQKYRKIEIVLDGINITNTGSTGFYLRIYRNSVLYATSYTVDAMSNYIVASTYGTQGDQRSNSYWQFFGGAGTMGTRTFSGSIMITGLYSSSLAPIMWGTLTQNNNDGQNSSKWDISTFGGGCAGTGQDITGISFNRLSAGTFTNNSMLIVYGYK